MKDYTYHLEVLRAYISLLKEQRDEAVAWAMADREGFADLAAWVASECIDQGVEVQS